MKTIIVEDDELSREHIKRLAEKIEWISIIGVFNNALDALNFLNHQSVELILLDIELPELSGIDLVKSLANSPQIIFTTSKKEYATEAFEYQATDYVTKPIMLPRLVKALERAKDLSDKKISQDATATQIFLRVDGRFVNLKLDDILYVETLGDYVTFYTEQKKKYIVHSTLKNIEDQLPHDKFIKVHRSYIINLSKVVDIEESNLVIADKVIPISRAHKPILMAQIKTL